MDRKAEGVVSSPPPPPPPPSYQFTKEEEEEEDDRGKWEEVIAVLEICCSAHNGYGGGGGPGEGMVGGERSVEEGGILIQMVVSMEMGMTANRTNFCLTRTVTTPP